MLENGAWRAAATLAATPQLNAAFGTAIALDDDVLVIGAPCTNDGRGAAFMYRRDARTGVWSEQSRLAVLKDYLDRMFVAPAPIAPAMPPADRLAAAAR